jgi:FtsH-binding integral membrane protein
MSSPKKIEKVYIKNTYLYVCIALVLLSLTVLYIERKKPSEKDMDSSRQIIVFIFSLICIISVYTIRDKTFNHIFWVLFILSVGYTLYPAYKEYKKTGILQTTIITTIVVVGVLSVYAYKTKRSFSGWGTYLFFGLLSLIIFQLVDLFINRKFTGERNKLYGYITVVLFSLFIIYDTNNLKKLAHTDTNPLYTRTSLSLFLDIINLFLGFGRSR